MTKNLLYYGDNLPILGDYIKDETIDLIYLDPPFKSNKDYNVLFAEQNGSLSEYQGIGTDCLHRRVGPPSPKSSGHRWHSHLH